MIVGFLMLQRSTRNIKYMIIELFSFYMNTVFFEYCFYELLHNMCLLNLSSSTYFWSQFCLMTVCLCVSYTFSYVEHYLSLSLPSVRCLAQMLLLI